MDMEINFRKVTNPEGETGNGIANVNLRNMSKDEMATIWYALDEYKKNVLKTATSDESTEEDEMFCYGVAAKCATLQYKIRHDHDLGTRDQLAAWMDIW